MRRRGFSLLEVVVSVALLTGVVLTTMLLAVDAPRASSTDRARRAVNLARSRVEAYRALPLEASEWQPGEVTDTAADAELDVRVSITEPAPGRRLLQVSVIDRSAGTRLAGLELVRTGAGT